MTDDQLLTLIRLVCDRFVGYTPDERMLRLLIADWRRTHGKGQMDR